jgi:hypothetical protein
MASLAFRLIYAMVSAGHFRVSKETGANAAPLAVGVVMNLALFVLLPGYTVHTGPATTWVTLMAALVASFGFEIGYRRATGRRLAVD